MKVLVSIDQREAFRQGIRADRSTAEVTFDPNDLDQEERNTLAAVMEPDGYRCTGIALVEPTAGKLFEELGRRIKRKRDEEERGYRNAASGIVQAAKDGTTTTYTAADAGPYADTPSVLAALEQIERNKEEADAIMAKVRKADPELAAMIDVGAAEEDEVFAAFSAQVLKGIKVEDCSDRYCRAQDGEREKYDRATFRDVEKLRKKIGDKWHVEVWEAQAGIPDSGVTEEGVELEHVAMISRNYHGHGYVTAIVPLS